MPSTSPHSPGTEFIKDMDSTRKHGEAKTPSPVQAANNRAVIVINQALSKPDISMSGEVQGQKSFINDDVFKQATDEETNYMKPNYHFKSGNHSKGRVQLANRTSGTIAHSPEATHHN